MKKVLRLVRRSHHLKLTLKIKLKKIKDIHSLTTLPKFYRYSNLMWFNTSMSTSMNSQEKVLLLNMQFILKKLQTNLLMQSRIIFCKLKWKPSLCNLSCQITNHLMTHLSKFPIHSVGVTSLKTIFFVLFYLSYDFI